MGWDGVGWGGIEYIYIYIYFDGIFFLRISQIWA